MITRSSPPLLEEKIPINTHHVMAARHAPLHKACRSINTHKFWSLRVLQIFACLYRATTTAVPNALFSISILVVTKGLWRYVMSHGERLSSKFKEVWWKKYALPPKITPRERDDQCFCACTFQIPKSPLKSLLYFQSQTNSNFKIL